METTYKMSNNITITSSFEFVIRQTPSQFLMVVDLSIDLVSVVHREVKFNKLDNRRQKRYLILVYSKKTYSDHNLLIFIVERLITRSRINNC